MDILRKALGMVSGLVFLQVGSLQADILVKDNITVTGTVQQQTGGDGPTTTPKKPVTIALLLKLAGVSGVKASDLRYFLDTDTNAFVLAPKTTTNNADVAPTAVIATLGTQLSFVQYANGGGPLNAVEVLTSKQLNDHITGTAYGTYRYKKPTHTNSYHIFGTGLIDSVPTILDLTIKDQF